jgi:carboxymethylenebutenolidase
VVVLDGEGRVPILYGQYSLPAPPHRPVYMSRPDLSGRHPSVVVLHGDEGATPNMRALCRRIARYGYVAAAPDLYRGSAASVLSSLPDGRAAADAVEVADAMIGAWSGFAASSRPAVLGLGPSGAVAAAVARETGGPLVLVGGPFDDFAHRLEEVAGPILGLVAGVDEGTAGAIRGLHASLGRGEWVVYPGVGTRFFDDGAGDYHPTNAADAFDRVIAFLDRHLAPVAA